MDELNLETRRAYADRPGVDAERGKGPGPALMGATTLVGDAICNQKGQSLAVLKEIMLDTCSGHVAYAVLASGGFLSIGAKLLAVPWEALRLDAFNKRMVLDVEKDFLEKAPGFDPDRWPDMADPIWTEQVHSYFRTESRDDQPLTKPAVST